MIRGARTHNLKNVDLTLPMGKLIVMTGVSGSGKSSLAFDTIYAEGQRRYVESLSAYARQFLERMEKPDVDEITGVCPAIAIRQKNSIRNPRSTVGTTTEIHDYLRLLFARVGRTTCRQCGTDVTRESAEAVARQLLGLPAGSRLLLGFEFPLVRRDAGGGRTGGGEAGSEAPDAPFEGESLIADGAGDETPVDAALRALRRKGFGRLAVGGRAVRFEDVDRQAMADCEVLQVVVDRVQVRADLLARMTDSVETAYAEGGGSMFAVGGRWCGGAGRRADAPLQRAFRMPPLRDRLRDPAAAALFVQQPVRRLSHLSRVR